MNTFARSGAAALTAALAFTLAACGGTTSTAHHHRTIDHVRRGRHRHDDVRTA